MKHIKNIELAKKYLNFLTAIFQFRVEDIEEHNHALYAKFVSSSVGIYFIYEFRDLIPQIQFTKLNGGVLKVRKGLYAIRELNKDEGFNLHSFYIENF